MICITVYSDGNSGVAQELRQYFINRSTEVLFIEHPLIPKGGQSSVIQAYDSSGKIILERTVPVSGNILLRHIQCALITFFSVLRYRNKIRTIFCSSNIDIIVSSLCSSKPKIYISIDFVPRRFSFFLYECIFRILDRIAYKLSKEIWHSYPDAAQFKPWAPQKKCITTFHGNHFSKRNHFNGASRNVHRLVYYGGVNASVHLDKAINAVKILSQSWQDTELLIIGKAWDPEYEKVLYQHAVKSVIEKKIIWHGQISNPADAYAILVTCGVALCIYETNPSMPSWYQLPGKIYAYAACGLPVLVLDTSGPITVKTVTQNKLGIVTSLEGIVSCLQNLFENQARYADLSTSTLAWASEYDWEKKFDLHCRRIGL